MTDLSLALERALNSTDGVSGYTAIQKYPKTPFLMWDIYFRGSLAYTEALDKGVKTLPGMFTTMAPFLAQFFSYGYCASMKPDGVTAQTVANYDPGETPIGDLESEAYEMVKRVVDEVHVVDDELSRDESSSVWLATETCIASMYDFLCHLESNKVPLDEEIDIQAILGNLSTAFAEVSYGMYTLGAVVADEVRGVQELRDLMGDDHAE